MTIRGHRDSDRDRIIELLRLNTPRYFSPNEEQDLVDYLVHHAQNYYVVEIDNTVLGCGGFNVSEDGTTAKISWDIFHPQSHGQGLGTALTKFRIQKIKTIGGVTTLSVRTSQLAYKFYEKFGMQTKEIVKDFWDVGFDLYRMDCDMDDAL